MDDVSVTHVALQTLILAAKLCAPILLTAMAVGFAISLLQAATQIQEVTLSFVPKLIAVAAVTLLSGNWMVNELITFTQQLFADLPTLLGQG
jgi:flagellar biosynthetic protein FliQ